MLKKDYSAQTNDPKDLFFRLIELYQSCFYLSDDYATKREKDFLWATYKVQKETNSNKLYTKQSLEGYKVFGFSKSEIDTYSRKISKKKLTKKTRGSIELLPVLNSFDEAGFNLDISIRLNNDNTN